MDELALHPHVYATGRSTGLLALLERVWVNERASGDGTLYIISGFANYNGGVRFFPVFKRHIDNGGRVVAIFGGSAQQRLTSRQVVRELLDCGVEVHIVNRRHLMHAKSYGSTSVDGEMLVVTSGNFTGPGMARNVEMSLLLDRASTSSIGFSWDAMVDNMFNQRWEFYQPTLNESDTPAWQLLYDEQSTRITLDETDEVTMVLLLGHSDTARIMATRGTNAAKGTQYFWLSRDCYDFFPPLTDTNRRGIKTTYSCIVNMRYIDIGEEHESRVTFEAENNLDFRLGTGPLRYSQVARRGDIAAITRVNERRYELRLYNPASWQYAELAPYAIHFIGNRGKRYGFLANETFYDVVNNPVDAPRER